MKTLQQRKKDIFVQEVSLTEDPVSYARDQDSNNHVLSKATDNPNQQISSRISEWGERLLVSKNLDQIMAEFGYQDLKVK